MQAGFFFTATAAAIQRDQLALLHIKLVFCHYLPLVMAVLAQGFTLMLFFQRLALEWQYVAHDDYIYVFGFRAARKPL